MISSTIAAEHARWRRALWVALLLSATLVLLAALGAKSLWVDELSTVHVSGQADVGAVVRDAIESERRPPLYFLIQSYWLGAAGRNEFALRFPSVFFAILCLPLLGALARSAGTGKMGLVPAGLLAFAPTFVLYSRMGRAYSMAVAVGVLSTLLFLEVMHHPSRRAWLGYIASGIILVYTDYALLSLLVAQNLYVAYLALAAPRADRKIASLSLRHWLAGQLLVLLAFLPWLAIIVQQLQRGNLEADFARGVTGYLLKLAYPVLSLSTGETIFPWNPAALLGLLCVAALFVAGVVSLVRSGAARAVFVLLFLIVPFLFTAILLSSVAADITFANMASRTLFAMPFFVLVLAKGYTMLPVRPWRWLALAVLVLAWGTALANYYAGRDFHNPIYVVPMREIARDVETRTQPGDIIVADDDSGFGYYYPASTASPPLFSSLTEADAAKQVIGAGGRARVWLITLGRDRTRVDAPGELFAAWLEQARYVPLETQGYAAEDPLYRRLKEKMLKRPDYEFKAMVRLYAR
jgi:uncharacterized membrane protein